MIQHQWWKVQSLGIDGIDGIDSISAIIGVDGTQLGNVKKVLPAK